MKKPSRVLYIIDSLGSGGAERALLNLMPELQRQGVQPLVISLFGDNQLADEFKSLGIEVMELRLANKWNLVRNVRLLATELSTREITVAHAHLYFSGVYLGLTRWFGVGVMRVITFHGLPYAKGNNPRNLSYFIRKALNWLVLKYCLNQLVAVSSTVAEHYSRNLGINKEAIKVIGNGILLSNKPVSTTKTKVADQVKTIVALGRLVPEKGYPYLLEAFARLRQSGSTEVQLVIIGGGPLQPTLMSLAETLEVSDSVEFCGALPHSEALDLLSRADIYVLSSVFEGFGLAVAEAMLEEVPVVVTRAGGVTDIAQPEFAEIVDAGNTEELANGIARVLALSDIERSRRIAEAKAFVVQNFSVSSVASKLVNLYRLELNPNG